MKTIRNYTVAIILGIFAGVLTVIGQKYLPINFNFLANSGAVWLVPAFFISYFSKPSKGNSIGLCIVCLLFCVMSYYWFEAIMNNHEFYLNRWAIIWIVMAFMAGSIFGLGAYFVNSRSDILKYCGMNLLPAVFFSEGMIKLIHLSDYLHMIPAVIMITCIGLIIYLIINRKDYLKRFNLVSFMALSFLGLVGHEVLYRISI